MIDPIYSDSMMGREDEWIPINPGTDAALVEGIAYVLITENLIDKPFLDKYCIGYDETTLPKSAPKNSDYKSHILGKGPDGIAKTPEWASKETGIPKETIIRLAREIGTTKPLFVAQGWGPREEETATAFYCDRNASDSYRSAWSSRHKQRCQRSRSKRFCCISTGSSQSRQSFGLLKRLASSYLRSRPINS